MGKTSLKKPRIAMIALGGCIKAPPVAYGITPDTGGHITYLLGEALALSARGDVAGVDIYTRRFNDPALGPHYDLPVEQISAACRIVRIDSGNQRYLSKEALAADLDAFTAALLAHCEAQGAPDIVHAHFADAAMVGAALRSRFGCTLVYTAHSLALDKAAAMPDAPGLTDRLEQERAAIAGADAVIGSSRDECERQLLGYKGARAERIHQVAPGIEPPSIDPAGTDRAAALIAPFLREPAKPFIFAIARAVEKKNLAALVDIYGVRQTLQRRANLVILAGQRGDIASGDPESGGVHRALLEAIDRHDLYGKVAIPKRHDSSDVQGLYRLARQRRGIFANPALFEPYGLTIAEAASHGVPTVATARGGPRDILERFGHGVAVDPLDGPAFGKAMDGMLSDPERWEICSRRGRERTASAGWDKYADRFMDITNALTANPANIAVKPAPLFLILSDIDNTLTGCRRGAARLTRLLNAQENWAFGVATGRSLQEAQAILSDWSYPCPDVLVTSVGSEIYWRDTNGLERDDDFSARIAKGWDADAVTAALIDSAGLSPQAAHEQRQYKRSYYFTDVRAPARARETLSRAGIDARVIASHGNLLDVLPAAAGKGAAMRWVAGKLGLAAKQVAAFGDSGNDADMLEACANGVMVANHSPEIAHLTGRANVRVTRGAHANGVIEGAIHAARKERLAS